MQSNSLEPHWARVALLAALVVGLLLRLHRLGAESLWYDETVSHLLASKTIPAMLAHTAGDIHPPGYYLLLHGWRRLASPTLAHGFEFLYAWVSLCFGLLIVALLYPIGRRLLSWRSALLAVWLAAINPFHIWYGQEVRMYTLGATLGLLCLWSLLKFVDWGCDSERRAQSHPIRWLAVYVIAAACGLYTLYYLLFLLAAINLIALLLMGRRQRKTRWLAWIGAQFAVLLLWSPWLPTFWRQATDPPVPPWRLPWRLAWQGLVDLAAALQESLAALLVGQATPTGLLWPCALLAVILIAPLLVALFVRRNGSPEDACRRRSLVALMIYIFAPLLLILLVSLLVAPLYHVRYLFTYAPPFMLLLAAALLYLAERNRLLGGAALGVVLAASFWGLQQFWTNPLYASDDHRAAVAELAEAWRPGDLILVNAGWVYTVLESYWPSELIGAQAHLPPPLEAIARLTDKPSAGPGVAAVRTGSVDGPPNLGWGDPASDFFAVPAAETTASLARLAAQHPRIWHYRLYDTVSDPDGLIRAWLDDNMTLAEDLAYPGRDFLRVQRFDGAGNMTPPDGAILDAIEFGDRLRLDAHVAPQSQPAGELLFVELYGSLHADEGQTADNLALSLRLYDVGGQLISQRDQPLIQSGPADGPDASFRQPLALPIPAANAPGLYSLEVVVYHAADGSALALPDHERGVFGQRWRLGDVMVTLPRQLPELPAPLASFDYIDLIEATPERWQGQPGADLALRLLWRPRESAYRDVYEANLSLRNADGEVVQQWSAPAGGARADSSQWAAGYPLTEWRTVTLPPELTPGIYALVLSLQRASDGLIIPARMGWQPGAQPSVEIAQVVVEP